MHVQHFTFVNQCTYKILSHRMEMRVLEDMSTHKDLTWIVQNSSSKQ